MLLVLDVGNTNTVMGIYSGEKLVGHWRLTSKKQTVDEVGLMILGLLNSSSIKKENIKAAIYASVVPSLDEMFIEGVKHYINVPCMKVNATLDTGLKVKIKNPAELGADRKLNSIAGIKKYGAPLIIVDLGTAITFDIISPDGAYIGGIISPGMELGMEALFLHTAKLPQIVLTAPANYIGRSTIEAIQSGMVYGTIGMIDTLIAGVFKELGGPCRVIATGGNAEILVAYSTIVKDVDSWLALDGMRIIYERNR
ncbi:MAG: type III pantothenate kinase [Synergistaceae bacterium]|nr:type III pantothenate kinase [Synergistaceae bacterium]